MKHNFLRRGSWWCRERERKSEFLVWTGVCASVVCKYIYFFMKRSGCCNLFACVGGGVVWLWCQMSYVAIDGETETERWCITYYCTTRPDISNGFSLFYFIQQWPYHLLGRYRYHITGTKNHSYGPLRRISFHFRVYGVWWVYGVDEAGIGLDST